MNNDYYVYVFLDPTNKGPYTYGDYSFEYLPFYVGKGKGKRCTNHFLESYLKNDTNGYKVNKIRKIKSLNLIPIIIKINENINEEVAFVLEKDVITTIGRNKDGGPLTNILEGGLGGPVYFGEDNGNYRNPWSEEQRKKAGDLRRGVPLSNDHKKKIANWAIENENPFKGKTHTKETRDHLSEIRKGTRIGEENTFYGKHHSDKTKKRISETHKYRGKYVYKLTSPEGEVFDHVLSLQEFVETKNITKINNIKFNSNCKTKYKNWLIERFIKEISLCL